MSPKPKAIALLSGGLDSTVALAQGLNQFDVVMALTLNYGQRAFGKELRASRMITDYYRVPHEVIVLPWLAGLLPKSMQMRREGLDAATWQTDARDESFFDAKPVWVPNRNGLFLNIAASYAEGLEAQAILFGANAEEAENFPDNTEDFRNRINHALELSTLSKPRVETPVGHLVKPQIIDLALELSVPLHMIWSCYGDAAIQCGHCPSCFRLKQALDQSPSGETYKKQLAFVN